METRCPPCQSRQANETFLFSFRRLLFNELVKVGNTYRTPRRDVAQPVEAALYRDSSRAREFSRIFSKITTTTTIAPDKQTLCTEITVSRAKRTLRGRISFAADYHYGGYKQRPHYPRRKCNKSVVSSGFVRDNAFSGQRPGYPERG